MRQTAVDGVASPLRRRRCLALSIVVACACSGCVAVTSVKRMDDNLEAIRPKIDEVTVVRQSVEDVAGRAAALQQTTDQLAATLGSVLAEMGALSGKVAQLSGDVGQMFTVVRDLGPVEEKLDLVNQELEHLSRVREGIAGVQRSLGKLEDLDKGIASINLQLGDLNDRLSELGGSLAAVTSRLEHLDSIDAGLVVVDDSIRKLHVLVPTAAIALSLLGLLMAISLYSQWQTRRRVTMLEHATQAARSAGPPER